MAAMQPRRQAILFAGMTAIFVAYFMVWLPGPSAGLQLIGVELGEWIKFLGVGSRRDWFYLPPIVLGLALALLAATWPNGRFATWAARGLAAVVALLSFPAVAAIQLEPRSEWLARLLAIALVIVVSLGGAFIAGRGNAARWVWAVMAAVALLGAIAPSLQYLAIRPVFEAALRQPIGIGPGVWLNAAGSVVVAWVALAEFARRGQKKETAAA